MYQGRLEAKTVAVVGAQWGDEGKGKVVDYLAGSFEYIARSQGGHNAGHTVIVGNQRFVLQLIPSGILRPGKKAVIGPGTVVDPAALVAEIETLKKLGVDARGRLYLSDRAHLIFPYHLEMDKAAEAARGEAKIGTTSRGIGPAYEDKMARRGIRVGDLRDAEKFAEKLERVIKEKNAISQATYGRPLDTEGILEPYLELGAQISGYIADTASLLNRAIDRGPSVLFEGAQGTMLDIDHGTYPYVTSSSATSGGCSTGLGGASNTRRRGRRRHEGLHHSRWQRPVSDRNARPRSLRSTRSRQGIRCRHGRPRRCGWLDLEVLRYAKMVNGIDSFVVTKLDVFDTQSDIQVCVGYMYKGERVNDMPGEVETFSQVTPVYKTVPGWRKPTYGVREERELPQAARDYLKFISDSLEVEIGMISTGPERDATIISSGTKLASWL